MASDTSEKWEFTKWWKRQNKVSVFFDGASKGNPRIVGAWGMIYYPRGMLETSFSWGLGQSTNNQAEILALLKAFHIAKETRHKDLQIFGDSEILIKVLNSDKQFSNLSLNLIMQRLHFILLEFASVTSHHILQELNKADSKANRGCQLPPGMLSLNEGPSLKHPIP